MAAAIDMAPPNFTAAIKGRVGLQPHDLGVIAARTGKSIAWLLGETERPDLIRVRVRALVTAGRPVEAYEDPDAKEIDLPAHLLPRGPTVCYRVSGESMAGEGIRDRDIIVCRDTDSAGPGDIVVATYDGETALRRWELEEHRLVLRADPRRLTLAQYEAGERPQEFRDIVVRPDTKVHVQGVVVSVIRQYEEPVTTH